MSARASTSANRAFGDLLCAHEARLNSLERRRPPASSGGGGGSGTDGCSLLTDSGVPDAVLGKDCDTYFDTATGDVYTKASGVWALASNITGQPGAPGEPGADGADGAPGADGGSLPLASVLPAAGTEGALISVKGVLFYDNGIYWWPIGGNMLQVAMESSHFLNFNSQKLELQTVNNGTAAGVSAGVTGAGIPGIVTLDTGTTNAGRSAYSAGAAAGMRNNADRIMHFESKLRIPTLSTGTERFIVNAGFVNRTSADSQDGYYFRYDDSVSANWDCVTANNAARTVTGSAIVIAPGTMVKLRIEVDEVNSSALFYIDNVLKATIATNFPGNTRDYGPAAFIAKSVGATARQLDLDAVNYWALTMTAV